jgi:hypothetical protein
MKTTNSPTPYPEVNAILSRVLAGAQRVLKERMTGMYLGGSLAAGGFNPIRSDIDFMVATGDDLPDNTFQALKTMHAELARSGLPWVKKLEGGYVPLEALSRYDPQHAFHPALSTGGEFHMDGHGRDVILQRHTLREQGIVLFGPPIQSLIDAVTSGELRKAARDTLMEWWQPQLSDPHRMFTREYQAYAVLTMCRAYYTIRYGKVVPKPVAAHWAQQNLDGSWRGLIERSMTWLPDDGVDDFAETLAFIRFTVDTPAEENP